jgi:hypothetical protein
MPRQAMTGRSVKPSFLFPTVNSRFSAGITPV